MKKLSVGDVVMFRDGGDEPWGFAIVMDIEWNDDVMGGHFIVGIELMDEPMVMIDDMMGFRQLNLFFRKDWMPEDTHMSGKKFEDMWEMKEVEE